MLDSSSFAYQIGLHKLTRICLAQGELPQSHVLDIDPLVPVAGTDIHRCNVDPEECHGLLNGSKVCVKGPNKLLS